MFVRYCVLLIHPTDFFSFFTEILFLYLLNYSFLAVLGLRCCTGNSLVAVHRLLTVVVSLVAEHRLWGPDFNSCDAWAR